MFKLREYTHPDFTQELFVNAPNAVFEPAEADGVAPENFHAMSIFPEYMKVDGKWLLAEESRMDCVAVLEEGRIIVREFRLLKKGDMVLLGRTENCEDGIYMHVNGSMRSARQRRTSPSAATAAVRLPTPWITTSCTTSSAMTATTARSCGSWALPSPLTRMPARP